MNGNNKCPQYRINIAGPFRFDIKGAECIWKQKGPQSIAVDNLQTNATKYEECVNIVNKAAYTAASVAYGWASKKSICANWFPTDGPTQ